MALVILRPNGAGDITNIDFQEPSSDFHWDKVDEVVADDNTTYVYTASDSDTVGDLYNIGSPPVGISNITNVKVWARVKKSADEAPTCSFNIKIKATGYLAQGGASHDPLFTWSSFSDSWATNPFTGLDWTEADLIDLQVGVDLKGNTPQAMYSACTQVYVEVTYTAGLSQVHIIG